MKTKLFIFILTLNVLSLKTTIGQPIYTDTNSLIKPEFFELPCSDINAFSYHPIEFVSTNYIADIFTIYSIAQPFRISCPTPIKSVVFNGGNSIAYDMDHYQIDSNAYYIQVWDHNFSNLIYQVRYDSLINEDHPDIRFREVFFDSTVIVNDDFYITFTCDTSVFSNLIIDYTLFTIYTIEGLLQGECDPEDYKYPLPKVKLAGTDEWIYSRDIPYPSHLDSLLYSTRIQYYQRMTNLAALLVFPRIDTAYDTNNNGVGLLDKGNLQDYINIYPNPAKDNISIESPEIIEKIELINPLGKVLFEKKVNAYNYQINLNSYPTGTYFIKVLTNSGQATKKVIKE